MQQGRKQYKETLSMHDNEGKKILQACLKRNKKHVIVMLVYMNMVKTSTIQRMNERTQKQLYPSVGWKKPWQSTNVTVKTFEIFLWLLNNRKYVLWIKKSAM